MCSNCSPGKLRLPYKPSSPEIVCRTCYMRARRFFADLIVVDDAKDDVKDCGTDNDSTAKVASAQHVNIRGSSFKQYGTEEDV